MFTTSSGIKRSFYGQTGDFQFKTNIILDRNYGVLDIGISGSGTSNALNFRCVSGKILDNNGNFVSTYLPNQQISISGNISSGLYDYFIDDFPVAYGLTKSTGAFNYFYIRPTGGLICSYDFFINGLSPNLGITSLTIYSGTPTGTGYIINNGSLPITIYSGRFTNFSSNIPFSFDQLPTGTINGFSSGAYYILPNLSGAAGIYTGTLQLITNGGVINLNNYINITGLDNTPSYSFNLNGSNTIYNSIIREYTSNIEYLSGSGLPIVVSLEHVSGSGIYYTNISVITGLTGITTGYIQNTGYLYSIFYTGVGTGSGGQAGITGSGFASGYLIHSSYATGTFTWPITVLTTGYGTGINYSGLGTGNYFAIITGTILAGSGTYTFNDQFTGHLDYLYSINGTGNDLGTGTRLYLEPFIVTGYVNSTFSGSGLYTGLSTGFISGSGLIYDYTKTFTGIWNLFTGLSPNQVNYFSGGFYNDQKYFNNYPVYYFDSTSYIEVTYTNNFDSLRDVANLIVSGYNVNSGLILKITGNY